MENENKQVEQVKKMETSKNLLTSSKYEGLGAAMAAELMIGFWFAWNWSCVNC